MKKYSRVLLFVLTIGTLLLSACGGAGAAATPNVGAGKVEAIPVAFVGMVDSIAGDQWVINGNTISVDPAVIRDGPFNAGDQVKVEGVVNPDGSFTVSRVETPTPQDASTLPQFGSDNSNSSNDNDANAVALAELWFGRPEVRNARDFIFALLDEQLCLLQKRQILRAYRYQSNQKREE